MYDVYITNIHIDKVRHLRDVNISLSDEKKHLILTGKNGSGKTSLLNALSSQLGYLSLSGDFSELEMNINAVKRNEDKLYNINAGENEIKKNSQILRDLEEQLFNVKAGLDLAFNVPIDGLMTHFKQGEFILSYYEATRKFDAVIPKHVEKVSLKENYGIKESPRREFVKFILDLKVTEAMALTSGKKERADEIKTWFENFERLLKKIFDDDSVKLLFDEDSFKFSISQEGRETFDFQGLSDGFAAVLDIVVDLMVRMEKHINGKPSFDLPGIVLIDEIETHLHLELQRYVLKFLTSVFPNIQFIVTTHSPFILNSAENAIIYDLENNIRVTEGLTNVPYEGIVRGYFEADDLSDELRTKFDRYKELVSKRDLSDDEMEEIASLELYLEEIPDFLALQITTEYRRLKSEFDAREDL